MGGLAILEFVDERDCVVRHGNGTLAALVSDEFALSDAVLARSLPGFDDRRRCEIRPLGVVGLAAELERVDVDPREGNEFVRELAGLDQFRVRSDRETARAADPEQPIDIRLSQSFDETGGQIREYVDVLVFARTEGRRDDIVADGDFATASGSVASPATASKSG